MFRLADDLRVYLHRDPIDFRAGINSLAILVEQSMGLSPFERAVFVFCNRLKYAGHHDIGALATIERALAIPQKRFERPMVGFLSRDEIRTIIEAPDANTWAGQRDRAMFSTLYNTGARVSEMIAVRWGDVVLEGQPAVHLHGKGRKDRSVPLWRTTAALLRS